MLTARPLQSVCKACRSKLLATSAALETGSRTLSTTSRARLHKRIRLTLPPQSQQQPSQRQFSASPREQHKSAPDDAAADEPATEPPHFDDEAHDGEAGIGDGDAGQEARKKTPAELVAAAREARQAYGDVLPEAHLTEEEYVMYERLYGAPLRMAPEEELFEDESEEIEEAVEEVMVESVRNMLFVEGKRGKLEEVEFFRGTPEGEREFEEEEDAEDAEDAVEDLRAVEDELDVDADGEAYQTAEEIRAHPLTIAGRFGTSPSTIQLPATSFVRPVKEILAAASKKHLTEAAHRVFGGQRLPHSASTPRPKGGEMVQRPIPLEPAQLSMTAMEGDSYLAAVMPGTYAAVVNVLVEVRKRLGTSWIEYLLRKEGGPLILDVSSGGAAVVAFHEVLKAEWDRMQEGNTATPSPAPLGKASVVTGSDTLRHRSARFLENTTFLPRLPESIIPGEKVGPKARKVYDIIVAPHALWSLKDDYLRKGAVQKLWSLLSPNGGVLILIEKGVPRGFEVVAGARALLLDNHIASPGSTHVDTALHDAGNKGRWTRKEQGMIVAPCTNHAGCPMYTVPGVSRRRKDFCYFKQRYIRPQYLQNLLKAKDKNHEDVQFSYLAVRKGTDLRRGDTDGRPGIVQGDEAADRAFEGYASFFDNRHGSSEPDTVASVEADEQAAATDVRAEAETPADDGAASGSGSASPSTQPQPINELTLTLPRIILKPLKRQGHVLIDVCTPAGRLERWTVPKSFGKQEYRDARKAQWGDLWALGAPTRVPRSVKLGDRSDELARSTLAANGNARLSKEDKRRVKEARGKTEKKGKETRRMGRERKKIERGLEEDEDELF